MTIRLLIAYALNLFDLFMTNHWVGKYGIEIEANPVGRWLFETGLAFPVKIIGIGAAMFALYACIKRKPQYAWTSWLVLAVYAALACYHLYGLARLTF